MKSLIYFLSLMVISVSCSCSKRDTSSYTHINTKPVVLVSHDEDGQLLGFIALTETDNLSSVVISPSVDRNSVHITPLGTKLHESITEYDWTVSSKIEEGYFGYVTAYFTDGVVNYVQGNTVQSPSTITSQTLSEVDKMIAEGASSYPENFPVKLYHYDEHDTETDTP